MMKSILLTTTALVLSAGVASADHGNISLTGSASAGVAREGTGTGKGVVNGPAQAPAGTNAVATDFQLYHEVNITAATSVETDSGLTFSTAISLDGGTGYDFADDDGFDALGEKRSADVGLDHVTISGNFGTLLLDANGIEHLVNGSDDASADVKFTTSMGDASIAVVADIAQAVDGSVDNAWSAEASTSMSNVGVRVAIDEAGGHAVKVSTTIGAISLSVDQKDEAKDDANAADPVAENGVDVSFSSGALSFKADWDSGGTNQYGYGVTYSSGAVTIGYDSDEAANWTATASYDLGGATLKGGVNYTDDAYVGVSFSF